MIKLLRLEFRKIATYKTFWVIIGLYFLFLGLGIVLAELIINSMVNDMNKQMPIPLPHITLYLFPSIWQNITFFASIRYILIFPSILTIILITNEYANKTIRQNVVTGLGRSELLLAKLLLILLLAVCITCILAVVIFILGISHSDISSLGQAFAGFSFIPGFFLMLLTFLLISFFFGFIFRNTGLAIALFTLYVVIIEPVVSMISKIPKLHLKGLSDWLPVNASLNIVEYPFIPFLKTIMGLKMADSVSLLSCGLVLAYSVILTVIVFIVVKKRAL
jgi:ABC-2 type transport system permease protein